jgi:hypothetical protein
MFAGRSAMRSRTPLSESEEACMAGFGSSPIGAAASCRPPLDLIAEGTSQAVKNGSANRQKARRTAILIPRSHGRNLSNRLPGLTPEVPPSSTSSRTELRGLRPLVGGAG